MEGFDEAKMKQLQLLKEKMKLAKLQKQEEAQKNEENGLNETKKDLHDIIVKKDLFDGKNSRSFDLKDARFNKTGSKKFDVFFLNKKNVFSKGNRHPFQQSKSLSFVPKKAGVQKPPNEVDLFDTPLTFEEVMRRKHERKKLELQKGNVETENKNDAAQSKQRNASEIRQECSENNNCNHEINTTNDINGNAQMCKSCSTENLQNNTYYFNKSDTLNSSNMKSPKYYCSQEFQNCENMLSGKMLNNTFPVISDKEDKSIQLDVENISELDKENNIKCVNQSIFVKNINNPSDAIDTNINITATNDGNMMQHQNFFYIIDNNSISKETPNDFIFSQGNWKKGEIMCDSIKINENFNLLNKDSESIKTNKKENMFNTFQNITQNNNICYPIQNITTTTDLQAHTKDEMHYFHTSPGYLNNTPTERNIFHFEKSGISEVGNIYDTSETIRNTSNLNKKKITNINDEPVATSNNCVMNNFLSNENISADKKNPNNGHNIFSIANEILETNRTIFGNTVSLRKNDNTNINTFVMRNDGNDPKSNTSNANEGTMNDIILNKASHVEKNAPNCFIPSSSFVLKSKNNLKNEEMNNTNSLLDNKQNGNINSSLFTNPICDVNQVCNIENINISDNDQINYDNKNYFQTGSEVIGRINNLKDRLLNKKSDSNQKFVNNSNGDISKMEQNSTGSYSKENKLEIQNKIINQNMDTTNTNNIINMVTKDSNSNNIGNAVVNVAFVNNVVGDNSPNVLTNTSANNVNNASGDAYKKCNTETSVNLDEKGNNIINITPPVISNINTKTVSHTNMQDVKKTPMLETSDTLYNEIKMNNTNGNTIKQTTKMSVSQMQNMQKVFNMNNETETILNNSVIEKSSIVGENENTANYSIVQNEDTMNEQNEQIILDNNQTANVYMMQWKGNIINNQIDSVKNTHAKVIQMPNNNTCMDIIANNNIFKTEYINDPNSFVKSDVIDMGTVESNMNTLNTQENKGHKNENVMKHHSNEEGMYVSLSTSVDNQKKGVNMISTSTDNTVSEENVEMILADKPSIIINVETKSVVNNETKEPIDNVLQHVKTDVTNCAKNHVASANVQETKSTTQGTVIQGIPVNNTENCEMWQPKSNKIWNQNAPKNISNVITEKLDDQSDKQETENDLLLNTNNISFAQTEVPVDENQFVKINDTLDERNEHWSIQEQVKLDRSEKEHMLEEKPKEKVETVEPPKIFTPMENPQIKKEQTKNNSPCDIFNFFHNNTNNILTIDADLFENKKDFDKINQIYKNIGCINKNINYINKYIPSNIENIHDYINKNTSCLENYETLAKTNTLFLEKIKNEDNSLEVNAELKTMMNNLSKQFEKEKTNEEEDKKNTKSSISIEDRQYAQNIMNNTIKTGCMNNIDAMNNMKLLNKTHNGVISSEESDSTENVPEHVKRILQRREYFKGANKMQQIEGKDECQKKQIKNKKLIEHNTNLKKVKPYVSPECREMFRNTFYTNEQNNNNIFAAKHFAKMNPEVTDPLEKKTNDLTETNIISKNENSINSINEIENNKENICAHSDIQNEINQESRNKQETNQFVETSSFLQKNESSIITNLPKNDTLSSSVAIEKKMLKEETVQNKVEQKDAQMKEIAQMKMLKEINGEAEFVSKMYDYMSTDNYIDAELNVEKKRKQEKVTGLINSDHLIKNKILKESSDKKIEKDNKVIENENEKEKEKEKDEEKKTKEQKKTTEKIYANMHNHVLAIKNSKTIEDMALSLTNYTLDSEKILCDIITKNFNFSVEINSLNDLPFLFEDSL